ncbi:hypothetical protein [Aquabacterium sp.]|uniref:hypothetical protein n=1 Tax=Aquabacterium sp. TaxID=1872578 RepID=UPI0035B31C3F
MFVPSLIAGWLVSREEPRFWIVSLTVALVFLVLTAVAGLYYPRLRFWRRKDADADTTQ